MKASSIFLLLSYFFSSNSLAGCESPFGTFKSKDGRTSIVINKDQTLDITKHLNDEFLSIYSGKFTNFDEMLGTDFLNYENAITIKPFNEEQSYILLHVSDDCSIIKAGIAKRTLDIFGGTPPKLDDKLYFKND